MPATRVPTASSTNATGGCGVERIVEVDVAANAVLDIELVRPGGEWMVYGSGTPQFALPFFAMAARNITLCVMFVCTLDEAERRAVIDSLTRLLANGRVIHRMAERLPLAQIADAHARIERGQVPCNIVLALD